MQYTHATPPYTFVLSQASGTQKERQAAISHVADLADRCGPAVVAIPVHKEGYAKKSQWDARSLALEYCQIPFHCHSAALHDAIEQKLPIIINITHDYHVAKLRKFAHGIYALALPKKVTRIDGQTPGTLGLRIDFSDVRPVPRMMMPQLLTASAIRPGSAVPVYGGIGHQGRLERRDQEPAAHAFMCTPLGASRPTHVGKNRVLAMIELARHIEGLRPGQTDVEAMIEFWKAIPPQ